MNLISTSIRRPVLTLVIVILAVLLGLSGMKGMGVSLLPKIEVPFVSVRTTYEGAGPEDIETLVSKPIEDAVSQIQGVRRIESTSLEGISFVFIEFDSDVNLADAALDVANRVRTVNLPEDADDPVVRKFDVNARSFMAIVFTSTLPPQRAKDILEDRVQMQLSQVVDVAEVTLDGGLTREIQVELDPVALGSLGLSIRQVTNILKSANYSSPSGRISLGDQESILRVVGESVTIRELEELQVPLSGGVSVRLADIATVTDGTADVRRLARYMGKDSFIISLRSIPDGNVVQASRGVREMLDRILPTLPPGFTMTIPFDDGEFIADSIWNVFRDMITGTALTALILFLFLQRLSVTLLVAIVMPTAIIATFMPMVLAGYTLNMMTTLGLAISTGVLVNNSILVIENIIRYKEMGYHPIEAAERGTKEIAIAVLSTTATNLGVFIPVALSGGQMGQMFNPFAMTVVFSTLFSLWVALTFTPMLAARIGSSTGPSKLSRFLTGWWQWLYNGFDELHHVLVKGAVGHPVLAILIFAVLTAGSVMIAGRIGFQFFPSSDEGQVSISMETSASASLSMTDRLVRQVEEHVMQQPFVKGVDVVIGGGGSRAGLNRATVRVYLEDTPERPSSFQFAAPLRPLLASLPDMKASITAGGRRGGVRGKPIQIVIRGDEVGVLNDTAMKVMDMLREVEGVVDVDLDWRTGRPEIQMIPDRLRMGRLNFSSENLSDLLRGYVTGLKAGVFRESGKEYDILVKLSSEEVSSPFQLPDLPFPTTAGFVSLRDVAELKDTMGPTQILRKDRQRSITVDGNVSGTTVGEIFQVIDRRLKEITLPPGYRFTYSGEIQSIQDNFGALGFSLALAVLLTFLMIAAILESFLFAFVIMLTVPLSIIGVVPALILTETPMSVYGLMGVIMLVGLVVNNAIVIIDYAEIARREGMEPDDAIIEACKVRLRPILMADATSVIAMTPLAMGVGAGGSFRSPMAIVAIGGLIAGGVLALLAIPPVYKLVWRMKKRFGYETREQGIVG
ncbi:efflux RND transporter permease subunit [Aminivibrio sp.]|uniref:efflux RND transporter permease subunit n=1 Tax=Aminivibrio sp. TaxID=1872489 RepID=UPI00345E72E7